MMGDMVRSSSTRNPHKVVEHTRSCVAAEWRRGMDGKMARVLDTASVRVSFRVAHPSSGQFMKQPLAKLFFGADRLDCMEFCTRYYI